MIHSASNTPGQPRPDAIAASDRKPLASAPASTTISGETLSSSSSDALRAALAATPEIRPEMVEKGKSFVVDANYPPRAIINDLAELFVKTQDLAQQD